MVVITAENYLNAEVHTIKVDSKRLFWVKLNDIQNDLDIKNILYLVKKEIQGIYGTQKPTKEQIKKQK